MEMPINSTRARPYFGPNGAIRRNPNVILLLKDDIMVARFKDNLAFKSAFDEIETKF